MGQDKGSDKAEKGKQHQRGLAAPAQKHQVAGLDLPAGLIAKKAPAAQAALKVKIKLPQRLQSGIPSFLSVMAGCGLCRKNNPR